MRRYAKYLLTTATAPIVMTGALACSQGSSGDSPDVCQVPPGQVAILIRLDGRDLPNGEFIARPTNDGEEAWKGLQLEVLPPGFHPQYRSDHYRWELVPQVEVPSDSVGVLVRLFGELLPEGQVFADENPEDTANGILRKGILAKMLFPGTHFINTRAFDVIVTPRVSLGPGQVGIVTHLAGRAPADPDAWVVAAGERGVQPQPLPPGAHYVNPYADLVTPLSRESQRIDLKAPGRRVRSPTQDGFDINLNGTLEWSVPEEKAPWLFARFGDLNQLQETLLMPATRAASRQQGVRTAVRDFLTSSKLLAFQTALENDLKNVVGGEGLEVHDLTVSGVEPPKALAEIVQFREAAALTRQQYVAEIAKAKSGYDVLRAQVREKRPEVLIKEKKSAFEKAAALHQQKAQLEIEQAATRERLVSDREQASLDAARVRREGFAMAADIVNKAELDVAILTPLLAAHGGGVAYSRALLIERIAPRLSSITSEVDGPLGSMLRALAVDPDGYETVSK